MEWIHSLSLNAFSQIEILSLEALATESPDESNRNGEAKENGGKNETKKMRKNR